MSEDDELFLIQRGDGTYFAPMAAWLDFAAKPGWSRRVDDAVHYAGREQTERVILNITRERGDVGARAVPDPLPRAQRYRLALESRR